MLVKESISFQRYKDPKTALMGTAIQILTIFSRFADVHVSEKEKEEILSDPIANKEKIKEKGIYLTLENERGWHKLQNFAGELVRYMNKLYLIPDSLKESISFQRYKDPKTALGLGKGAAIKIISIESRFADVFVSEKEKDEILSDPIANKEKIKKKEIYLDIRNGGGLFKVQDFAGELVSYNEKLYLMPDSLTELGEIFNLVRESISFERYKDPKEALGFGKKEITLARIETLRGTVDEEIIEDFIIDLAEELGGIFEVYLDSEDKETLYWLYKLLGKKGVKVRGYDLEDYTREKDNDYDEAYNRINAKTDKWIAKGWEIFHEEQQYEEYSEYIFIKYE